MYSEWIVSYPILPIHTSVVVTRVPSLSHLQNQVDLFYHYMMSISCSMFLKDQAQHSVAQMVISQVPNTSMSTLYAFQACHDDLPLSYEC